MYTVGVLGTHSQVNIHFSVLKIGEKRINFFSRHPFPDHAVDLPNLYKRSIVFFRSLHSLVRILPSYELYRKLHKLNDANPLSIGYRLSSSPVRRNTEIAFRYKKKIN